MSANSNSMNCEEGGDGEDANEGGGEGSGEGGEGGANEGGGEGGEGGANEGGGCSSGDSEAWASKSGLGKMVTFLTLENKARTSSSTV